MSRLTPSSEMTLGPFFPREFGHGANDLSSFAGKPARGAPIEITGRIVQGDGKPLDNAIVEIWQASAEGRLDDPDFLGWGRAATNADGVYSFKTVMPGSLPDRAPHVNVAILFSGLMRQLQTTLFFSNQDDPVLLAVPAALRALLIARFESPDRYRFDIRTQGDGETPFFDD
ncbi:MAG: protocatechuate 3,4-dioxygenase subunit alpha [Clostridia bacterium]